MKRLINFGFLFFISLNVWGQYGQYEETTKFPFGRLNPNAPSEVGDYHDMIGKSSCKSINRNPDGTWQDTLAMSWTFKYIMDGSAVQDITIKDDGAHSSSVRLFRADSAEWFVTYFSINNPQAMLANYFGNKNSEGDIVLSREQKIPNGLDGVSWLTFSDISKTGFNWEGKWVSADKSIEFPFWRIHCNKTEQ